MNFLVFGLGFLLSLQILNAAAPLIPTAPSAMVVDSSGYIYLAGGDNSGTIPTTVGKFHVNLCAASPIEGQGYTYPCYDAFVMKLDPTGTRVIYATYIGGSSDDAISNIAVDAGGNAYVIGTTDSSDFPITPAALKASPGAAFTRFVAKLNPNGSLSYATYFGGSGTDLPLGIQVDGGGNAYVAGATFSSDFPTTSGIYRAGPGPGFVSKINPTGTALVYSTYFEAAPTAMALNAAGAVYLTGHTQGLLTTTPGALQSKLCGTDCSFVTILNPAGSGLIYSSFLGGNALTQASSIALDPGGSMWVAGITTSSDFPSSSDGGGAFVVKINASGSGIAGSLLFGSNSPSILGFDQQGNAHVFGSITPNSLGSFSPTPNALLSAPCPPAFGGQVLLKLDPGSKPLYASYARQALYTPVVLPSGQILGLHQDPFAGYGVSIVDPAAAPQLNFSCPVNSASWNVPDGLVPGEIVSIFGSNLGPAAGARAQFDTNGRISTSLAGTVVLFNSIPAPLLYVQSGQINTVVPFESANAPSGLVTIQIQRNGKSAPALDVLSWPNDPGLFTQSERPGTEGVILNQDGTLNSASNPAKLGSIISLFGTGFGALTPPEIDGQISPKSPPFALAKPVTVAFAGVPYMDNVVWAGAAPGLIAGVTQINVRLPASLTPGIPLNAVPVSIGPSIDGPFSSPVLVSVAP